MVGACKNYLRRAFFSTLWTAFSLIVLTSFFPGVSHAKSTREIDVGVDVALERFKKQVMGAESFLKSASGVLVFPSIIKAGIGIGGEYGEGALRIGGKTAEYYSAAAASIGFQLGVQERTVIVVFMQDEALRQFRGNEGWKAGVDGSVAMIESGMGRSLDTASIKDPIVGFIFGQKGLMFNLTLEGSKFTRLNK